VSEKKVDRTNFFNEFFDGVEGFAIEGFQVGLRHGGETAVDGSIHSEVADTEGEAVLHYAPRNETR